MAKHPASAVVLAESSADRPKKVMYLFPNTLLRNVELCAWKLGKSRTAIVRDAIAAYLLQQGLEPFEMPKQVTLKYDRGSGSIVPET